MGNIFQNVPVYVLIIPAIMVLYLIGYLFYVKRDRNKKKDFMAENPTASTIYCQVGQKGIKSLSVQIHSIDGGHSFKHFQEGLRVGYVLMPGTHVIEASASTTRPGVVYKSVSETFGPTKLEVEVGTAKTYMLEFDIKNKEFTFNEK